MKYHFLLALLVAVTIPSVLEGHRFWGLAIPKSPLSYSFTEDVRVTGAVAEKIGGGTYGVVIHVNNVAVWGARLKNGHITGASDIRFSARETVTFSFSESKRDAKGYLSG